ncbi:MAG: hypothetical protein P0Y64_10185 [Candidatus Sphingomonas colombiensis]|nr:hypothetical protein [Sphingomonas sp.]WEK41779.1 MAG: hypothetical protein P0Y64_10185 [Sphingomonas sp.]
MLQAILRCVAASGGAAGGFAEAAGIALVGLAGGRARDLGLVLAMTAMASDPAVDRHEAIALASPPPARRRSPCCWWRCGGGVDRRRSDAGGVAIASPAASTWRELQQGVSASSLIESGCAPAARRFGLS